MPLLAQNRRTSRTRSLGSTAPATALVLAAPASFLVAGVAGAGGLVHWLATWGTAVSFTAGALLCGHRARTVEADRGAWTWLAVACGCWAAANTYYALVLAPGPAPMPSPLDAGYAAFPVAVFAGLVAMVRARRPRVSVDVWLDGLTAALTMAALAAAVVFWFVDVDPHHLSAVITTLVYPIEDVVLLGTLGGVGSILGWRLGREWRLVGLGVLCILGADVIVLSRVLQGSATGGAWTNALWTSGIALFAVAARRRPTPPPVLAGDEAVAQTRMGLVLPVAFTAVSLLIVVLDGVLEIPLSASLLAAAALAVSCVRLYHAFREVRSLADSRRLARTDDLTALANRRRLLADLDVACNDGAPKLLALFDLDGFKRFNDMYGHVAGDHLLRRLASSLAAVVEPDGVAYRLGGDEFCVLIPESARGLRTVDAAAHALVDSGDGWAVTASFGVVRLPREASTTAEALRVADRRMYAQKDRRPAAARQQARDVLLSALGEQQPLLRAHVDDVTTLAGAIAAQLGMTAEAIDDVVRAAELHDVGKLAIPREILDKPGPLDDGEWEVMRRHTIIGERMLLAAPALAAIAPLVRHSHERWDGGGYPDGVAGDAIPLGARIVAVCDAFDAMISDRSYRAGMPLESVLEELRVCAGSQFDPQVVHAFVHVYGRRSGAPQRGDLVRAGGRRLP
jgi:diguanylate cyclase (GGDEF)-like protein